MKTKIVATVGPACSSREMLGKLIKAGVDVFRLNFSHGSYSDHLKVIEHVRSLNNELGTHIALLGDLQGPKIRIGAFADNQVMMPDGHELVFTTIECTCTADRLYITYPEFARDVKPGEDLLLDDGKLLFRVISTNGVDEVKAVVIHGGILSGKKGVNLPNTEVSLPSLTEKDRRDLAFILEHELNWIALSFVRKGDDIRHLKTSINELGIPANMPGIIAKIEKPDAVKNMDEIIAISDGIMVARGDLGVELPLEQVPLVQKRLIRKCNQLSKPIIVATQMMEGMISNIRPTRAEVNDVANSVLDGADAVMLSGETSIGRYPEEVVETMQKIIWEVEKMEDIYNKPRYANQADKKRVISDSILSAACSLAIESNAGAIIAMTITGYSALRISSQRPKQDIFIFTSNRFLLCKLNLVWGIKGFYFDKIVASTTKTFKSITDQLIAEGRIKKGDLLIKVASTPIYVAGQTNTVKLDYA
ncbi:MAG: pyruvate kinase [Lentimicrobiaceae bacterium]|jgi:pyruvate kinase